MLNEAKFYYHDSCFVDIPIVNMYYPDKQFLKLTKKLNVTGPAKIDHVSSKIADF